MSDMEKFKAEFLESASEIFDAILASFKGRLIFNDKDAAIDAVHPRKTEMNDDTAVFYRVVRPSYFDKNGRRHAHPTKGFTLRFEVNYASRIITVSYGICDGDLFCKELGRHTALMTVNHRCVKFPIPPQGFNKEGIVDYFMRMIGVNVKKFDSQTACIKKMLAMYHAA